jgi:hypothetical protein
MERNQKKAVGRGKTRKFARANESNDAQTDGASGLELPAVKAQEG